MEIITSLRPLLELQNKFVFSAIFKKNGKNSDGHYIQSIYVFLYISLYHRISV